MSVAESSFTTAFVKCNVQYLMIALTDTSSTGPVLLVMTSSSGPVSAIIKYCALHFTKAVVKLDSATDIHLATQLSITVQTSNSSF